MPSILHLRLPSPRAHCANLRLLFLTLFYNSHLSWSYAFDTLMEPLFWCVDIAASLLGPAFVLTTFVVQFGVVFVAYAVGLPHYWQKSQALAVFLVAIGQFFFVNLVFNYYMALRTGPGTPPREELLKQVGVHAV